MYHKRIKNISQIIYIKSDYNYLSPSEDRAVILLLLPLFAPLFFWRSTGQGRRDRILSFSSPLSLALVFFLDGLLLFLCGGYTINLRRIRFFFSFSLLFFLDRLLLFLREHCLRLITYNFHLTLGGCGVQILFEEGSAGHH